MTRKIKTGRGPYNLAVTPDGTLLLATLKPFAALDVYDIATGKILATIRNSTTDVGQQAGGIAFWKMEPPK